VQEAWFAGCHSDVGGGAVEDCPSLTVISLQWMVKQVVISKGGIEFDATALRTTGIDAQTLPEEDALADIHDELKIKPDWRGGGEDMILIRAGNDSWKGRQPMESE
jgi:hypothetical protein